MSFSFVQAEDFKPMANGSIKAYFVCQVKSNCIAVCRGSCDDTPNLEIQQWKAGVSRVGGHPPFVRKPYTYDKVQDCDSSPTCLGPFGSENAWLMSGFDAPGDEGNSLLVGCTMNYKGGTWYPRDMPVLYSVQFWTTCSAPPLPGVNRSIPPPGYQWGVQFNADWSDLTVGYVNITQCP
jgi:hypothetical protein